MIDDVTLKKWENDYINNIDINNREYLHLTKDEMISFINDNYYDCKLKKYVNGRSDTMLIGLQYLDCTCNLTHGDNIRYLVCTTPNNIGKKTILSNVILHENCTYIFTNQVIPVTLIEYCEVNSYFRNIGLSKDILKVLASIINYDNIVFTTSPSVLGSRYHLFDTFKSYLRENGFNKDIAYLTQIDENYYKMLLGYNDLELKRKI